MRDSAVLKWVGASEGLSFFCNGRGDREVRCNGRGKPTPLRKANRIVRIRKRIVHIDVGITKSGWDSAVSERGGGVAIPPS